MEISGIPVPLAEKARGFVLLEILFCGFSLFIFLITRELELF